MKKLYSVLSLILITNLIALGQVPQTTSFQGVLTDSEGTVVADGNHSLNFKLFDSDTDGTLLWQETQNVSTVGGIFNVILGKVIILDLPFDKKYWLEIYVDGGEALSPRVELTSSFYSLMSKSVEDSTISTAKLQNNAVTTEKLSDGAVTQDKLSGSVSISPGGTAGGDLEGSYPNPTIAGNAVNSAKVADSTLTSDDIATNLLSSIDGVDNDGGNVDLVGGSNITIVPNNSANTITISAEKSSYYRSYTLNNTSITATTTWQKISDYIGFTKKAEHSAIEVYLNSNMRAGIFSGASAVQFEIRIDNVNSTIASVGLIRESDSDKYISIMSVFSGLSQGSHTVSVWARTNSGTSSGTMLDPGGWGGRIIAKETF